MEKLELHSAEAQTLLATAVKEPCRFADYLGQSGLVVDAQYRLADGRFANVVCRHGWLYDLWIVDTKELAELMGYCPYGVRNEVGLGGR